MLQKHQIDVNNIASIEYTIRCASPEVGPRNTVAIQITWRTHTFEGTRIQPASGAMNPDPGTLERLVNQLVRQGKGFVQLCRNGVALQWRRR